MDFSFQESVSKILHSTGFVAIQPGQGVMIVISLVLLYLAIWKKFEPLLLLPIGFGCLLANLPLSMMANTNEGGLFNFFYYGVRHEILPPLIFLGVGALTDLRGYLRAGIRTAARRDIKTTRGA